MKDASGLWWPDLNPKGYEVFNCHARFLLLTGPRKSTKTACAVNRIIRHMWENNGAKVAIIGKTIKNIKSSGVWQDLTVLSFGLPQWLSAGIGLEMTVQPKLTGDTKVTYFRLRNKHGGESECQVHSLEHDWEVEVKFKGTRYSLIYLPEADQFKDRLVFNILEDQLRCPHISDDNHQMLIDCNPPEEGDEHFLYDLFFRKVHPTGRAFSEAYAAQFKVIQFTLGDNIWMGDAERQRHLEKYLYDPALYSRYADGSKWEKFSEGGHFHDFFMPNLHIRGNIDSPDINEHEIIIPEESCLRLVAGWDMGDVNHSWSLFAPIELDEHTHYPLIDEVVVLDRKLSIETFVEAVLERMEYWEHLIRSLYGRKRVAWTHWSDPSAFRWRAAGGGDEAMIVRQVSSDRILLQGVPKPSGSVAKRLSTVKRLLFDGRLSVSAICRHHIDMLRRLKKPKTAGLLDPADPLKHMFDSMTYALVDEVPLDLQKRFDPRTMKPVHLTSVSTFQR